MSFHHRVLKCRELKYKPLAAIVSALVLASPFVNADEDSATNSFTRIATFPVYLNSNIDTETVAEIVSVSKNGKTLIYTDGKLEAIGFVDINDPENPKPAGILSVGGEPTSVAVKNRYALAAVNTSVDYIDVSGNLIVIDIKSKTTLRTIPLGGQPDSIAVSPDGKFAAVVIENERNEDLNDGMIPQSPPGKLIIVDLKGKPDKWTTREVELSGLTGMLNASDPEPEYVDISKDNIAVVTLQENNHIVLVDLKTGRIVNHFSAGTQDLNAIDIAKDKLITLDDSLKAVPREPDGVSWLDNSLLVTADEGDLDGGSRGYTIYQKDGTILYESGNSVEHSVVRHGHYPEKRAGKKGNEPENVETGIYNNHKYLFVGSERGSVTLVYDIDDTQQPILKQVLPTSVGPEGLLAIPGRNLFVAAGEKDAREDKFRSALSIYQYSSEDSNYPTLISSNRPDETPIPWGALSGLAAHPENDEMLYSIHDSFYNKARIFQINIDEEPAVLNREIVLMDKQSKLADIDPERVNEDGTVNIDQEGIAIRQSGGFWIASEGAGTIGDINKPFVSKNLILGVTKDGIIDRVIELPQSTNARQVRFGFEGVTSITTADSEVLLVAFQRGWADDKPGFVRIGRYELASNSWRFYYYPLETPLSALGGWVGLSEITALDNDNFLVIERDNQANEDAVIKRIYRFSTRGLTPLADPAVGVMPEFPVVEKHLVKDLMPELKNTKGLVLEKIEGLAMTSDNDLYIVNDNDGVDDSNGETQLLEIEIDFED